MRMATWFCNYHVIHPTPSVNCGSKNDPLAEVRYHFVTEIVGTLNVYAVSNDLPKRVWN